MIASVRRSPGTWAGYLPVIAAAHRLMWISASAMCLGGLGGEHARAVLCWGGCPLREASGAVDPYPGCYFKLFQNFQMFPPRNDDSPSLANPVSLPC